MMNRSPLWKRIQVLEDEIQSEIKCNEQKTKDVLESHYLKLEERESKMEATVPVLLEENEVFEKSLENQQHLLDIKLGRETYLEEITLMNLNSSEAKEHVRAAYLNSERTMPDWVFRLKNIIFVLDHFGYANKTRWRSRVCSECKVLIEFLQPQAYDNKQVLMDELSSIQNDINIHSARSLIEKIQSLLLLSEKIDIEWGNRMIQYRESFQIFKSKSQGRWKEIVNGLKEINNKKEKTVRNKKPLNESIDHVITDVMIWELKNIERVPSNQHSRYLALLSKCASLGLWYIAFTVYKSMLLHCPLKINTSIFRLLITACKHAHNSFQAIQVLDEMEAKNYKPSISIFNALVDSCVHFGEWRRASLLLLRMTHFRVFASSVTYDTLLRIAQRSDTEHSPAIYDAYKFAGVPEALAFACARQAGCKK